KYVVSSTHRILKNRNCLIIAPLRSIDVSHIVVEEAETEFQFAGGKLQLTKEKIKAPRQFVGTAEGDISPKLRQSSGNIALLDASDIKFPLILRKWKPGDYFYPLGMRKKKKLARFFIDQKLSATDKEKVWVLEMDKKIIWVVGMRIDDRFKITDVTSKILRIEFKED
ncbi:MAG TPA: tRNA lysidine(34) synthetase TilS, partial [Chitinophagaceae bacterium]